MNVLEEDGWYEREGDGVRSEEWGERKGECSSDWIGV